MPAAGPRGSTFRFPGDQASRVPDESLHDTGLRPNAKGKRRGGRGADPLQRLTRKLDKWCDANPFFSGTLSVGIVFLFFFLFWQVFGGFIGGTYDSYLKQHCDPYVQIVIKFLEPHFVALSELLKEKRGFWGTLKGMFVLRILGKEL